MSRLRVKIYQEFGFTFRLVFARSSLAGKWHFAHTRSAPSLPATALTLTTTYTSLPLTAWNLPRAAAVTKRED
jgi:hypothetical protein